MRRGITLLAIAAMLLAAMAAPAAATKPDTGTALVDGHKITICHATRSLSNPYVEITIDIAAWNDTSDDTSHGLHHTRIKNGVEWWDYVLLDGQECTLPPPASCDNADFTVRFSGDKLISNVFGSSNLTEMETVAIGAGTYDLLLGSRDERNNYHVQDNEQWRAVFSDGSASPFYAEDLPDGPEPPGTLLANPSLETFGGRVTFAIDITSVTAEHWSVANTSNSPDSVIPDYVCLIKQSVGAAS